MLERVMVVAVRDVVERAMVVRARALAEMAMVAAMVAGMAAARTEAASACLHGMPR